MKKFKKNLIRTAIVSVVFAMLGFARPITTLAAGPTPVNLGLAGNFAILSKAGITDVPSSHITGNIGAYPISGTAIHVTCPEVTGTIYSRDAAGPLPCRVTNAFLLNMAVNNMGTAYTNAAGRAHGVGSTNLNVGGGTLSGQNFAPGTYTWNTPVSITGDITLTGTARDVWIFQISGTLNISSGKHINLAGGALPQNIFWQVAGATTLGTTSTFEGTILDQTNIALLTGAVLHGRALAQTAVTLDQNTVSSPSITGNNNENGGINGHGEIDNNRGEGNGHGTGDNDHGERNIHSKLIHVGLNPSACTGPFSGQQKGNVSVQIEEKGGLFQAEVNVHGAKPNSTYDVDIRCVGKIGILRTNREGEGEVVIRLPQAPKSPFYVDISIPGGGGGAGNYGDTFIAGPFTL